VKVSFHGAAREVTGSCHLIECAGKRVLIDCGLFQGGRELVEDNAGAFGFDAGSIDVVLLTHAHLDHCGRLPLLVKRGFRGEIVTTAASRELARLVMLDSARLQEEDAARRARRHARRRPDGDDAGPLYSLVDAMACLDSFGRTARYGEPLDLAPGVRATFFDAGHILGSASVFLELTEGGQTRRVTFSGDIGNAGRPLLNPPTPPPPSDVVVMETTYGDRDHRQFAPSVEELYQAIEDTFRRGGNVIIPTFALERAQELLYYLHTAVVMSDRLPRSVQVFLDSPMAISATEIYRRHADCLSGEAAEMFRRHDPFTVPGLHFTRETAESMAINRVTGGAVIMAGSGMATGGRVRHHLKHNLWRVEAAVVFVAFAARGTLARIIIDGAGSVRIFGEDIPVKAKVYTIGGFSAHADRSELVAWHRAAGARRTFLVHGEERAMQALAPGLAGTEAVMPERHAAFDL
jgi:metallo-beta-lactamase family protein